VPADTSASFLTQDLFSKRIYDFFHVHVFGDDIANERNLFRISRSCLDGEIVNLGSDLIAVSLGQQHRNRQRLQGFHHTVTGTQSSGQDDASHLFVAVWRGDSTGGEQDVFAVAGRDKQHAALEKFHRVLRAHRTDDDVVNECVERRRIV